MGNEGHTASRDNVFSPESSMPEQVGDNVVTHGDTNAGQGWLWTPEPW